MNKKLVRCPVCKADQHIYRNAICNHDGGILRCLGSKTPLINGEPAKTFTQNAMLKMRDGILHRGFIIRQKFWSTDALIIIGATYELQEKSRGYLINFGGNKIELNSSFDI